MNDTNWQSVLAFHLNKYRSLTYQQLLEALNHSEGSFLTTVTESTDDGSEYHIEFNIVWDDKMQRHIRVIADFTADPPRKLLDFLPITVPHAIDSFIMTPDGTLIGE